MTYRTPEPEPRPELPEAPPTIEEQIAADVKRFTEGVDLRYSSSVERYVEARLKAHWLGYGPLRLWWQDVCVAGLGYDIRAQERQWAEQRDEARNSASVKKTLELIKEKP